MGKKCGDRMHFDAFGGMAMHANGGINYRITLKIGMVLPTRQRLRSTLIFHNQL